MTKTTTATGGASLCALSPVESLCVTYGLIDGEAVAYLPLQHGGYIITSTRLWNELLRLGYRHHPRMIGNGRGGTYAAITRTRDRADLTHTSTLSSIFSAILAESEGTNLPSGWTAVVDDPFDLRAGKLKVALTKRGRSAWRVRADVRKRMKLVEAGLDPNRVFAERRRAAQVERQREVRERATRNVEGGISQGDMGGLTGPTSPLAPPSQSTARTTTPAGDIH